MLPNGEVWFPSEPIAPPPPEPLPWPAWIAAIIVRVRGLDGGPKLGWHGAGVDPPKIDDLPDRTAKLGEGGEILRKGGGLHIELPLFPWWR